jgi:hypothetical protein
MKTTRMLLTIAGWFTAGYALISAMVGFELHWNFFNWSPKLDLKTFTDGLMLLAIIVGIWFLAQATRDRVSRVVSLLVCLLLVAFAFIYVLPAEPMTGGFLGRTMPSPLWYRGGCSGLLCLPGALWLFKVWHNSVHDSVA